MDILALTTSEATQLAAQEQIIERGLKTFTEVGNALAAIRDAKLYRAEFGTFEEYCQARWNMTRQAANRLVASAEVVKLLEPIGSVLPQTESQARPLARLTPEAQREVWQDVVNTAPKDDDGKPKITAKLVAKAVADYEGEDDEEPAEDYEVEQAKSARAAGFDIDIPDKKPHVSRNTGNNEWYTPAAYIIAARAVMGGIDCDPASSEIANNTVGATVFYTAEDDGLGKDWSGRVWMNPPYAADLIWRFCETLNAKVASGEVTEAIVLVNNSTETAWFYDLVSIASAVVFPKSRVKFVSPDGEIGAPLQGQAVIYIGPTPSVFLAEFSQFGWGATI